MPVMQLFAPANLYAVARDHDYLELTSEDRFLLRERVCVLLMKWSYHQEGLWDLICVSSSVFGWKRNCPFAAGQCNSKRRIWNWSSNPQPVSSQAWKDERCKRITASKFGVVCKVTERDVKSIVKSLLTWRELRVPAVQHGRKYESVAAEMYKNMTGQKTLQCGLFVSQQHPVLAASPDRVVDEDTLLEIKCPFAAKGKQISPTTVPYLHMVRTATTLLWTNWNAHVNQRGCVITFIGPPRRRPFELVERLAYLCKMWPGHRKYKSVLPLFREGTV